MCTCTPNDKTATGFRMVNALCEVLEPLLPVHVNQYRFGGGRPRMPDCTRADGIFYLLWTDCQRHALDETELVEHSTAHDRYQEWVRARAFLRLWKVGIERFDELQGIDWGFASVDGAMTKALFGGKYSSPNEAKKGATSVKTWACLDSEYGWHNPSGLTIRKSSPRQKPFYIWIISNNQSNYREKHGNEVYPG